MRRNFFRFILELLIKKTKLSCMPTGKTSHFINFFEHVIQEIAAHLG